MHSVRNTGIESYLTLNNNKHSVPVLALQCYGACYCLPSAQHPTPGSKIIIITVFVIHN